MKDIRQIPQYARHLKNTGWIVEYKNGIYYFIKRFSIVGSVIKLQRPEEIRNEEIKKLRKKYRALQIIIEPKDDMQAKFLESVGFKLSKKPYLPTKTLQLDLTISKDNLLSQLKSDCRTAIKKNQNIKIKNYGSKDVKHFRKFWKKAVGLKRYVPPTNSLRSLITSFKQNSLFITDESGTSGAIFLIGDKIGYYWQAFTSEKGRKTLTQYKIVWKGINWAKSSGAKVFDFEGTYDKRFPNESWRGFTHFKKSFGGEEVSYPGCYTKRRLLLL
jgi:lipid II:glycine glycyltransferase (peptidoglycan interpeptide bridge formation enzyme)